MTTHARVRSPGLTILAVVLGAALVAAGCAGTPPSSAGSTAQAPTSAPPSPTSGSGPTALPPASPVVLDGKTPCGVISQDEAATVLGQPIVTVIPPAAPEIPICVYAAAEKDATGTPLSLEVSLL